MNVLTWNGAVLRLDAVRRRLVQDPGWMTAADGGDFVLDRLSPVQSGVAPEGLETLPGHLAGTIRIAGAAGFLSAQPSKRDLSSSEDGSGRRASCCSGLRTWPTYAIFSRIAGGCGRATCCLRRRTSSW